MTFKIELLARNHNRQDFDCGNVDLNRYLCNTAYQHIKKGISRTFVLTDDATPDQILGFFTLASCEIFVESLPDKYARKYPSRAPAAKLARLAVSRHRQKKGLGTYMMTNAMKRVLDVSKHLGIIGFFVDAKDDKAAGFYRQFGYIPLKDNPLQLFLPLATIQQVFSDET